MADEDTIFDAEAHAGVKRGGDGLIDERIGRKDGVKVVAIGVEDAKTKELWIDEQTVRNGRVIAMQVGSIDVLEAIERVVDIQDEFDGEKGRRSNV